jgi:radical SAM superfamily enzyme YgiQ (UPF0313 family)
MNLELIAPLWRHEGWEHERVKDLLPPLGLAAVAAVTPERVHVSITDENLEDIDYEKDVDLVGITASTPQALRAYEIADKFRGRGIKVALGGLHPSALPEEALQHADIVVVGQAEGIWEKVMADVERGESQKVYVNSNPTSLEDVPIPRKDLFTKYEHGYLTANVVQTTRGCPFNCSFCVVTSFFGRAFHHRRVEDVVEEVKSVTGDFVFFVDDNITVNQDYARLLFESLIPLGKKWVSQASIDVAKDDELLSLASRSGCIALFIGFETLSQDGLREIGKTVNKRVDYKDAIARIRSHGIGVYGAFVLGLDIDTKDVFEKILEFAINNRLEAANFAILTPHPGTRLRAKLEKQNRIIHSDWSKYDGGNVAFKPKLMSPEELQEGHDRMKQQFYSFSSIIKRLSGRRENLSFFLPYNFMYNKSPLKKLVTCFGKIRY